MKKPDSTKVRLKVFRKYFLAAMVLWTVLVALLLAWGMYREHIQIKDIAIVQARHSFQKDLVYRRWAAEHGGVYVPSTPNSPPNPYLEVQQRDIETPSGKKLTLINPAYMTRQVHEMGEKQYGLMGHITSLKLKRPQNKPDEWERQALLDFENNRKKEAVDISEIDGRDYLRFMRPMITEESCLKCHAEQGYKVGDTRGGISISVPMEPLYELEKKQMGTFALGHGVLWLMGIFGISVAGIKIHRHSFERENLARFPSENPNPVMRVSEDCKLMHANSASQIILEHWSFKVGQTLPDLWCDPVKKAFASNTIEKFEIEISDRTYAFDAAAVVESGYINLYGRDITDLKKFQHQLKAAHDQLEQKVRQRTLELHESNEKLKDKIEQLQQAEEQLIKAQTRYRTVADFTYDWEYWQRPDGGFEYVSPSCKRITGYSAEEFIINPDLLTEIMLAEDRDIWKVHHLAASSHKSKVIQYRIRTKDGQIRWIEHACRPVSDSEGNFLGFRANNRDITDRKQAEEQLRTSESRLLESQRLAHLGNWEWDIERNTLWWSDEVYRIFGLKPRQFEATYDAFLKHVHPADRPLVEQAVEEALKGIQNYNIIHRVVRPDGTERFVNEIGNVVLGHNRKPVKMIGTVHDVTAKQKAENVIRENQKKLRGLTAELQLTEERERRQLAQDLHDSIGQILAFSLIQLKILQKQAPQELTVSLEEVTKQLNEAVGQTRTLSFDLSPSTLYDLGFEVAIEDLLDKMTRERNINCKFDTDKKVKPLADDVKVLLYRSVRELLINAAKHAKASEVRVTLTRSAKDIHIDVIDNGKGFDPNILNQNLEKRKGFGIFSIRERLNHIGGQMKIDSAPGKGTKVMLIAPLDLEKK